jgi:hypothetical protein
MKLMAAMRCPNIPGLSPSSQSRTGVTMRMLGTTSGPNLKSKALQDMVQLARRGVPLINVNELVFLDKPSELYQKI